MADYKKFFEWDNPLNIYSSNNSTVPIWQTDEYKKKKQQEEADERWKRLQQKKAAEQTTPFNVEVANNFVNSLLSDLNSGKFDRVSDPRAMDAQGNMEPIEGIKSIDDLYGEAQLKALYSKDLNTGEYRYPELIDRVAIAGVPDVMDNLQESVNIEKDVTNLVKDMTQFSETGKSLFGDYKDEDQDNINSYRELIGEQLVERGLFSDEEEAKDYFDAQSEADKTEIALGAIGRKYFRNNPEQLKQFTEASNYDRLAMLVSKMKSNPFYQSENEKYKSKLDALYEQNIVGPLAKQFEGLSEWGKGIQDRNRETQDGDFITKGIENYAGALTSTTGKILGGLWSLIGSGTEAIHGEWTNDEYEKLDETINNLDEYFIQSQAQALADTYIREDYNAKQRRAEKFDELSKQVSPTYKQAMGSDLVKMPDVSADAEDEEIIDAKLKKLAEIETRQKLFGKASADKSLDDFWKSTTAQNQGALDYIMNTAGVGATSLSSDLLASAAILANLGNPYMYTGDENDSGYTDALLKHNIIMDWATGVQKWGEENFHTYKTTDEENSFISARDIPDLVGQYGFTIASKWATIGGSAAVRGATSYAARKALQRGVQGTIARGMIANKGLRETIKAGLKAGKGTEEYTKALEAINQVQSKRLYNLNLAVGAAVGTAEGAIEAQQTYTKFKEDNNVNALFDQQKEQIEGASLGQLQEYMKAAGYQPVGITANSEGGSEAVYTQEQYAKAKQELLAVNEQRRQLALDRLEDDALDAAATNFMFNSLINGAANVLLKESLLSDDVKAASRRMKGKTKGLTDLIDVVKGNKGWEARVKDAVKQGDKNIWRNLGAGTKKGAKVVYDASKASWGEMLEEYGQTVSDDVSRAALQADLNNYLNTIYDEQSHEAFNTDMLNVFNAGLDALGTSMTNKESLKAGLFGFLSTMAGGINYGGLFTAPVNLYKNRSTADFGTAQWYKETGKNILSSIGNLYDGAVFQAFKESREDGESARKLAENVNEWLNNPSNQELLTHLGGAIGFKKLLENSLISRDDQAARDDKLGLAVENIFMLRALQGTQMADAYQKSIDDQASLANLTTQEAVAQNFDTQGNYIGEDKQAASAIAAFKEQFGQASDNMTDLQILQRVSQNALEFKDLQQKIDTYSKQVEQMYHEDNLDPIVQQAYVQAMIQQDKSRSRRDNLKARIDGIFDKSNENLTEEDQALIDGKSGLDKSTINTLAEYGSLKKASTALDKIKEEINKIEVALAEKPKASTETEQEQQSKRVLKHQKAILEVQKKQLETQIAHAQESFNERNTQRREQQKAVQQALENENRAAKEGTEAVTESSIDEVIPEEIFTVGDIVDMSTRQRSAVLSNKKNFSAEQQQEIDKFLTLSRKLLAKSSQENQAEQAEDLGLTEEDVIADYVDLAALDSKVSAYDNYLYDYIQNPQFMNIKAQSLKEKQRKKTLQFYYRDDLKLKAEETVLDMLDRVNKQIDTLKQIGRTEDASILESLVNENPALKKMRNALREVEVNLAATVAYNPKWKDKEKEVNQALTALRTLISSSGMGLKEIKGLLDALDTKSIMNELLKQYNGEFLLNTQLKNSKQDAILTGDEVADETTLNPIIQTIKDILDDYYNTQEVKEKRGQSQQINVEQPKERSQQQAEAPASSPKENNGVESNFITVITPGSTSDSKIATFLATHKASEALATLNNPGNIKFMVSALCKGTTFVVVSKGKRSKIKGDTSHLFEINGECYQVIGYIKNGQSSTIDNIATSTSNTLPNGASRILQDGQGDIQFSINTYGESKSKSYESIDLNNPPSLSEKLTTATERHSFAQRLVTNGKVEPLKEVDDVTGEEQIVGYNIEYMNYPVTMKKVEDADGTPKVVSLFGIPLKGFKLKNGSDNPTLAEVLQHVSTLLQNTNDNIEEINQIIKDLKKLKFFETLFNTWEDYAVRYASSEHPWEAATIYNQLIGSFIYLGKPYEKNQKFAALHPQLSEDRSTLTISSTDQNSTISIPIPNPQDGNAGLSALKALITIFNNTLGNDPALQYHNPTLRKDIIEEKGTRSDTTARKNIEIGVVEGLIELGVLNGYIPQAIDRQVSIMNKFYSQVKNRSANNPNLASPDNSRSEAVKPASEERVKKELTEGQKKAKAIVDRIKANSKTVELPDTQSVVTEDDSSDQASYYQGNGTQYARVTSTETAARGHNKGPVEITGRKKVMSTSHGNTVDTVVRTVFNFLNNSSKVWGRADAKALYEEITKQDPFKNGIPNYDKSLSIDFLKQLIDFYNIAQSKGWTIVPEGIKAFGTLNVFNETGKVGTLPTAGTLDLLLYDEDGKFFIVDIKTMHKTSSMNTYREEREEGWTVQINDYQYLLQQQYSDMEFTGQNYVLSFAVDYKIPGLKIHQGIDGMSILDSSNRPVFTSNREPQMVKDPTYAEGVLLPIKSELQTQEDIEKYGLDYSKLTEEQRRLVIPFQEESSGGQAAQRGFEFKEQEPSESIASFQPEIAPEVTDSETAASTSLEDSAKAGLSGLLGRSRSGKGSGGGRKKSQRTVKQARFTDFMNNHVAPLNNIKVNIFGKIKQTILEFLDIRDNYQKLMISDLANTFFQGNINQMTSILKGLKVTPANMPKIVDRLRSYFKTYIGNENILIHNVQKRQQSYKALYDYLKGNITEAQFQDALYKLNIEANDMPELIDYINSTDKENERRRILQKLEISTIHTEEDAKASIEAIKKRVDNMRTKLEFLSLSSASSMLNRRMESIKNAIGDQNISTQEVQTKNSMKSLLNGEDKVYGADNLLAHISKHSKNTFFRQLASTLQSYIRQQNMSITVSVDDQILNVEGDSKGRNITIYKDSLDSYEHLERVLLHEILHSVLLVSPKIKAQLNDIIEKATANIARASGKTIAEVKKSYYGLTNADEFISEFFTNYAFQEILKTVPQEDGNNTTASIIGKLIKNLFNKDSIYNQAYKVMKDLLRENSLEEMIKTDEIIEDIPYVKHLFKNLKGSTQEMIKLRGITEEEFDNMTAFEQEHLEECCK